MGKSDSAARIYLIIADERDSGFQDSKVCPTRQITIKVRKNCIMVFRSLDHRQHPPSSIEESEDTRFQVFVLSGGTGMAGEQVARTVLAQFLGTHVYVRAFSKLLHKRQVKAILRRAAKDGAVITHMFVDPKLRKSITKYTKKTRGYCHRPGGAAHAKAGRQTIVGTAGETGLNIQK